MTNYEIWIDEKKVTITANTRNEAKAYACGIAEGLQYANGHARVQVYTEEADKLIFDKNV